MVLDRRGVASAGAGIALVLAWRAPLVTRFDGWVGVSIAALGVLAAWLAPRTSTGLLLCFAAVTWFASNVAASDVPYVADLAARLVFVHRAVLAHAVIVSVSHRMQRMVWPGVAVLYLLTISVEWQRSSWGVVVWGSVVVITCVVGALASWSSTSAGLMSAGAALTIAGAVTLEVHGDAYRRLMIVTAALVAASVAARRRRATRLADSVVELVHGPSMGARARLAKALGDPHVELAFADGAGWSDELGRSVSEPHAPAGRILTVIEANGERIASLVHLPDVEADPRLRQALHDATALAATNVRLRSEVRHATAEVVRSRRRLVDADHAARAAFSTMLRRGPDAELAAAAAELSNDRAPGAGPTPALSTITQIRADFDNLRRGLGPLSDSDGDLELALQALADRAALDVHLESVMDRSLPAPIAEALWFVASEGLSNVVKHTTCSHARVTVRVTSDLATLVVSDDGGGGAEPGSGTGLCGLADRVEAIGGNLGVVSSPTGTRVVASVPMG